MSWGLLTRRAFANSVSNLVITVNDQDLQPPIRIKVKISDETKEVVHQEAERNIDTAKIPNGKWVRGQRKY